MSNVALIQPSRRAIEPRLGSAHVHRTEPHRVEVVLPSGELAWARLALAFSYEPRPGDEVLVIGNDEGHYVIGVLHGTGTARLSFPGDVELRSQQGRVRIAGAEGVELDAPQVGVRTKRFQLLAHQVVERLGSLYQHITEGLNLRAGSTHTIVEDTSYTQARRSTLLTRDEVTINGKSINLG